MGLSSNAFFHGTVCTLYLAMGAGCRGMCLFVFYTPLVFVRPRRSKRAARLTMEKDQCLHAPHGLTSTKQSQPSEKPEPLQRPSNQMGSSKGVFSTSLSAGVEKLFRLFIWAQEASVAWERCGPFLSCELCFELVLCCCGFLLCRQDAMFPSFSHFITERHCEGMDSH